MWLMPYGIYMHQVCDMNKMFHQVGQKFWKLLKKIVHIVVEMHGFSGMFWSSWVVHEFLHCVVLAGTSLWHI